MKTTTVETSNSQIQPAFVKHTRKYCSINQLMDIILPKYPNIETLAVLYDEMSQGKYQKVNIKRLTAVVFNQDTTRDKLDYAKLMVLSSRVSPIYQYLNGISIMYLMMNSITSNSGDLILRLLHQKHMMAIPIINYTLEHHLIRIY